MTNKDFYSTKSYRHKQSEATKKQWQTGIYDNQRNRESRSCRRVDCNNCFEVKASNPKKYCSQHCAAVVNNSKRVFSQVTKEKISKALAGRTYPERKFINALGKEREYRVCLNPDCRKEFFTTYWRPSNNPTRYCSVQCSSHVNGSKPTSPRAARAKAGVRPDIDKKIYFFSRWEANYARVLNLTGIKWIHQPKRFRLKSQYYTPDFYLPESDKYIEIKNFLSDYSLKRDKEFRELYPKLELELVLKEDYKKLEEEFANVIPNWEFSNSKWTGK
ncbi:hypothetical protein H6788_02550 [Candidatus Nomurabacteria bacterium]|nr:hypothetical protein [Candidatus Nomurabacteria bacterium]